MVSSCFGGKPEKRRQVRSSFPVAWRCGKQKRQSIADTRRGIYKSIGNLRAQHRCNAFSGVLERLPECISRVTAFRAHMASDAAVDGGVAERIASIYLQKLGHCKGGDTGK